MRLCYAQQAQNYRFQDGAALAMTILARFGIPKAVSKKRHAEMLGAPCIKRGDADNLGKIVMDALNGVAYKDDAMISRLHIDKVYSDEANVVVVLERLGEYSP